VILIAVNILFLFRIYYQNGAFLMKLVVVASAMFSLFDNYLNRHTHTLLCVSFLLSSENKYVAQHTSYYEKGRLCFLFLSFSEMSFYL